MSAIGAASACDESDAARRAGRLLRWYPRVWRDRYGEEFAELLIADIEERPRAVGRTVDVILGGFVARLSAAGLCGLPIRGVASSDAGPSLADVRSPRWRPRSRSRPCS